MTANGGATWRKLPLNAVFLVLDPGHPGVLYGIDTVSAFQRSADGAATWTPQSTGLPGQTLTRLTIDQADPGNLYALTSACGLYRLALTGAP